jgi:hypothetical protein
MAFEIQCLACSWPIPVDGVPGALALQCPRCFTAIEATFFPAVFRPKGGAVPEALEAETDASCFFHPRNRAAVACDECGRFLCKLCELEVAGGHVCPDCFNKGVRRGKKAQFEGERTMHDSIALAIALYPLLFWPMLVISAPATLFWIVRNWNRSRSIVPRSRIRFYAAALIAVAEIVGVTMLIITIVRVR